MVKTLQNIILIIAVIFALYLITHICIYIFNYYEANNLLFAYPKGGGLKGNEIGDSIGGILNPLIGLCAALLTFLAFYMQKLANDQVKNQFAEQKIIDNRQNFENTFFNLLSIHHEIVSNMDFDAKLIVKFDNGLSYYIQKNIKYYEEINQEIEENINFKSRDVFKFSYNLLHNLLHDDLMFVKKIETNYKVREFENYSESFKEIKKVNVGILEFNNKKVESRFKSLYDVIYFKVNSDLGHYFRNLYRIFKMVDEKRFVQDELENFKIQYSYTSIIRAQLSDDEIKWLFFNCLTDRGKTYFKPLIEKYTILKIINVNDKLYGYYKDLYSPSAFSKPTNNLLDHINSFKTK